LEEWIPFRGQLDLFCWTRGSLGLEYTIASATRFPFYEAVANNHFTSVLMPDAIKEYRGGLIGEIEQEYIQIYDDHLDAPCRITSMPAWEELRPMAVTAIDAWLKHIAAKVAKASRLKIEVYLKYRPMFEAEGDKFRVGICDACIAKNRDYIRELDRIAG
jgi:hypothetical protein